MYMYHNFNPSCHSLDGLNLSPYSCSLVRNLKFDFFYRLIAARACAGLQPTPFLPGPSCWQPSCTKSCVFAFLESPHLPYPSTPNKSRSIMTSLLVHEILTISISLFFRRRLRRRCRAAGSLWRGQVDLPRPPGRQKDGRGVRRTDPPHEIVVPWARRRGRVGAGEPEQG